MSALFESLQIGRLRLANRIVIPPMCQYSAEEGSMGDWHLIHYGQLASSGAGLLILEATAISPEARISPCDIGLWGDANEAAMARVLRAVRAYSEMPIAVQLGHAGRKASTLPPWEGRAQLPPGTPRGWKTVAPSALPAAPGEDAPLALDRAGLDKVRRDFVLATQRAARLGLDAIEIHGAHGYLLHQFLSPLSNHRDDAYGGSLENRMRFPLEIFEAVRAAFPVERPVWMRVSATDWIEGGWDVESTIALTRELAARGCAAIHVSSGGLSAEQKIPLGPGYQVPLAARVKAGAGLPTIAVGLITEAEQAEAIVASGQADAVGVARGMLYDPRWPWHAAAKLGAQVHAPKQYWRSQPRELKTLFAGA